MPVWVQEGPFKPEKHLHKKSMRKTQCSPAHKQAVMRSSMSMRSETITAASLLGWGKPFESVSSTVPRQREEEEGLQRHPDCYHHICQAGGCQAQRSHTSPANGGSSRQVSGTAGALQQACNCKQPPGSRRRAPGFPVPRGSLVHLHQAQTGCSIFKRLISFLFAFKGNIWVLHSPGPGHDGWAVCVGTAAQFFSLKQPAWSHA